MNESIEMILHAKKLRYEILDSIFKNIITKKGASYDSINIFVDVHNMLNQLYKPDIVESINSLMSIERQDIASELINIVSHYRHYFFSRWWKYTNFYFFYSSKRSKYHMKIDKEYRRDFYNKHLKEPTTKKYLPQYEILNASLESAVKMCKSFLMYVPHAYFIDSEEVDYTLVPHILMNNIDGTKIVSGEEEDIIDVNIPTIILSNDDIYFQDIAKDTTGYFMQLMMKGNKSHIVNNLNIFDTLTKGLKNEPEYDFSTDLYSVVLSFMGNSKYNIDKVNGMGIGRALPFVNKNLFLKSYIHDMVYTSLKTFTEAIENSDIKEEFKEKVIHNFKLLSHDVMDNIAYSKSDILKIKMDCSKELVDAKAVRRNNERYFNTNPVLVDFCFEGENY